MTADSSRDKLDELAADFEAGFDLPVIPAPTPAANPAAPGEGLKGLLSRRPAPPAPERPEPDPSTGPAAAQPPAEATTRTKRPAPAKAAVSSEDSTGGLRPTSFSVPATLIDRLATFKAVNGGLTTADVLLDALEDTETDLPKALGPAPSEGRFTRSPQRARRRSAEGRLGQLHVRLMASNFAILDDLVTKSGASSRSHLVTTALTLYLDKNPA